MAYPREMVCLRMQQSTTLRFCVICGIERAIPEPLLDGFALAPRLIEQTLRRAPINAGTGWTRRDVLAHLADSEVNFGARIRLILAETEPLVSSWDQERWADALQYGLRDEALDLTTFVAVRDANVDVLERAGEDALARTYLQPPYGWRSGDPLPEHARTLGDLVRHRADHDLQHLAQIVDGSA
jgi:DinB family protein